MTTQPAYPIAVRTLDNGLRVVASPTPGIGLVAVNLWYDVGSRHERADRHGFAHLFEHLMFQGSRHVESGQHFALVQANGGSLNATTSFDRTNYFDTVPRGALDLALWLEADRMAYLEDVLTVENFRTQVEVVGAERRQRMDNVPYGTALERLLPLVFDADHPYGHLPIGDLAHLDEATLDEVGAFHARYYLPSNAVLTVTGDATADEVFAAADRYFGQIPSGERPERLLPEPLSPRTSPARLDLVDDVPAHGLWWAARFPADDGAGRDLAAVLLASSLLGDGETSRLHRRLVRSDESAISAGMGVNPLIGGNSLGIVSVRVSSDAEPEAVSDAVREEIERFAADGPTDTELERARAQAEREWLDEMATAAGRADALSGCALLYGDPDLLNERLGLLRSIRADEVRAAAATWVLPALQAHLHIAPSGAQSEAA